MKIEKFDSIDSTNKYCERLDLAQVEAFTVIWALSQTDGIGQRGNRWSSAAGENLTFSIILKPEFLPAEHQFRLTQALSLGVADFLGKRGIDSSLIHIKWPNDIYVAGKKICGMLISNHLAGTAIKASICGIGLNVNQTDFPTDIPNPTSLCLQTGRKHSLEKRLDELLGCIYQRYHQLEQGIDLTSQYHRRLLHLNEPWQYKYNRDIITATITGTDSHGHLLLTTYDGDKLCCSLKEIQPLLKIK